jgi:hypothetical protein
MPEAVDTLRETGDTDRHEPLPGRLPLPALLASRRRRQYYGKAGLRRAGGRPYREKEYT